MSLAETVQQSSIDHGVDRKQLKTIRQRFLQVNNARLARTKSALASRHQIFLELLPMMFHVNHPMLPGYISHQTPAGLVGYNPSKRDLQKAQRLARSFTYHRQPTMTRQIDGIYLMGSCGTVAQSDKSDLDIWLCHGSDLTDEHITLLRKKADRITHWADSIGLEAHFFLMEDQKFRQGERQSLSTEDCGSSQHFLLLDEFYRTGLLIAGRVPIWWLIPPEEEQQYDYYAETLRKKRFVKNGSSLDFGNVGTIPAGEFIGAGVWQLYKAIDSPYKSVLKILLTEVYAAEFPNVEPLSATFKKAIYNDRLDIDELDPYVVVYRKLEAYLLARNELKRLELVRRCFYFKVGKNLSRPGRNNNKSWQRKLMEKLVAEWQWPHEHLYNLDARNQWKVTRVMAEQKELVRELTNSYRFVLEFARRTRASAMINSQEMTILGRKLYAAFERKAGKIEWINPGIASNLNEQNLTFYQIDSNNDEHPLWAVSAEESLTGNLIKPSEKTIIKRADEITTLLAWCHYNGMLDSTTRVTLIDGEHSISEFELHSMIRSMRQKLPVAKQYSDQTSDQHQRFAQAMRPTQLQLFINVGIDPLAAMRSHGIERLSSHTDSLGYSGLRENLVLNLEQVLVNSWGEVSSRRYDGEHALVRCLRDYLQMVPPGTGLALPSLDIRCFCPTRANAIASRVEELFRDIAACYYSGTRPACSRYIIEIQREYYVLQFDDNRPNIELSGNYNGLLKHLAQPQSHYSPIVLDSHCLQNSILSTISDSARADEIQVFYQQNGGNAEVFILDEKNSLCCFSVPFHDEYSLLAPLDQFIQSTLFRRSSETGNLSTDANLDFDLNQYPVAFYQLVDKAAGIRLDPCKLNGDLTGGNFFNVQAIGSQDFNGNILFNIYCDQQEFTELEWGKELYNTVAQYILGRRRSRERYPCYITDLDLSHCDISPSGQSIQTIHYLQFKQRLEKSLNSALQLL